MILEGLSQVVGLYDVTVQSDYHRNTVKLEQIMDSPSDDDILTLVESAGGESLMQRRRRTRRALRVDCCYESWVSHLGAILLSHPLKVSLEREAALPINFQSAPPSARVFYVDWCFAGH